MTPYNIISDALGAMARGETSSEVLTEASLEKARQFQALNIFAVLDEVGALAAARESDARRKAGSVRRLEGVPITIKDLYNVRGMPARGGSRAPMPDLGPDEGTAVTRLRAAGAVIVGTTNMHEVGLGLTGENPSTGDVKNPFDPARQVGGSSSGAGAAMGADIGFAALGSDTGGSIRVPGSHCGASSFKPSFGLVPLDGVLPLAPTCDHAGPITNSVQDARLVAEIMAAKSLSKDSLEGGSAPKLGVPWRFLEGRLSTDVRRAFEALVARVKSAGGSVVEATPADIDLAPHAYTTICWAEATQVHRAAATTEALSLFTPRVQLSLKHGLAVTALDYLQALEDRRRIIAGFEEVFARGDVEALMLPVTPTPAPLRGTSEVETESGTKLHRDAFLPLVVPFSLSGLPIVSIPFACIDGLPIGLQVVAPSGYDFRALEIGRWLEMSDVRDWTKPHLAS
jgi:aspartyl-tRNA(Asn)/glutamyl-tRNA(Gln) amidotransferase subunit A